MARILVVDDSPDTLQIVAATLESGGHDVVALADAEASLQVAQRGHWDAAILDVMMPGRSGWEILEALRQDPSSARVPIIMLSAIGDATNRTRGIRLGADDFLAKPFDPDELLVRVERLVMRHAAISNGLQGGLETHPLSEVIQNLELNGKTGVLEILTGPQRGWIAFRAGKICGAGFASYRSRAAVLALLEVTQGNFRFSLGDPSPSTEGALLEPSSVLIEAAWIDDELGARRHLLPPLEAPLLAVAEPPPLPDSLRALPILEVLAELREQPGSTLQSLLAQHDHFAPASVRLAVAWLRQLNAVEEGGPTPVLPTAARADAVGSYLRGLSAPPGQRVQAEVVFVIHAPAWDSVAPLLAHLPQDLLGPASAATLFEVWRQRGGALRLRHSEGTLDLTLDSFHNAEGAILEAALQEAHAVILWLSADLPLEGAQRLMADVDAASPTARRLVTGFPGSLTTAPHWKTLLTTPESLEELLYELAAA